MTTYELQTYCFCDGYINMQTDDNEQPIIYSTKKAAMQDLKLYLSDIDESEKHNHRIAKVTT
tara:strand:+ start:1722 stop:1907 length:186 start_codon:yes stop_codon:yes gene_type:complete